MTLVLPVQVRDLGQAVTNLDADSTPQHVRGYLATYPTPTLYPIPQSP
jgi:hypothetical protein